MPTPEEFLPFASDRERLPTLTQIRSTLIASSVRALQTRGDFERYLTHLPERYHDVVSEAVPGTWMRYEIAHAHYIACNQLGYGPPQFLEIGRDVGNRIHGTILVNAVRMAKSAGMTPWSIFAQFRRLWERTCVGGGIRVIKMGPKEAHVEVAAAPLVAIPYYRFAQRAVFLGLVEMFCTKAYASDVPAMLTPTSAVYRFAWA